MEIYKHKHMSVCERTNIDMFTHTGMNTYTHIQNIQIHRYADIQLYTYPQKHLQHTDRHILIQKDKYTHKQTYRETFIHIHMQT